MCVGLAPTLPLTKAYWAVVSFEARQKMVDAAMRAAFQYKPRFLAEWDTLNNRLVAKNKVRNKIAHGSVVKSIQGTTEKLAFVPYFYANMDTNFDHGSGRFKTGMGVADLNAIAKSFGELNRDLREFQQKVFLDQLAQLTQVSPSEAQASQPPHYARARFQAALTRPLRSLLAILRRK